MTNAIQSVASGQDQPIKTTKVKKSSHPTFIVQAQKLKLLAFHKWHSNGRIESKNIYRQFSRDFWRRIKGYHKSQESLLVSAGNIGRFYRFVNRKLSTHNPIQEIKSQDGTFTSDPTEMANVFNNYFCSVFTADDGSNCILPPRTNNKLEKIIFTPDRIYQTFTRNLKPSSSS